MPGPEVRTSRFCTADLSRLDGTGARGRDHSEGWVCRPHQPPRRTPRRTAQQTRSCSNWSTRTAPPSARRRSSPPTRHPANCTGPSRCSFSTSRAGCCCSGAPWASTTPRRLVQHLLRSPVSGRGALRRRRPADARGTGHLPLAAGRGGHRPVQPPGPRIGSGGAGVQPSLRGHGAGAAAAGSGGGERDGLRIGGGAGRTACQGAVLGLVHDGAGCRPARDPRADRPGCGLVATAVGAQARRRGQGPGVSGSAAQMTFPPPAVCATSQAPPASRVISRTSSSPRPPVCA